MDGDEEPKVCGKCAVNLSHSKNLEGIDAGQRRQEVDCQGQKGDRKWNGGTGVRRLSCKFRAPRPGLSCERPHSARMPRPSKRFPAMWVGEGGRPDKRADKEEDPARKEFDTICGRQYERDGRFCSRRHGCDAGRFGTPRIT